MHTHYGCYYAHHLKKNRQASFSQDNKLQVLFITVHALSTIMQLHRSGRLIEVPARARDMHHKHRYDHMTCQTFSQVLAFSLSSCRNARYVCRTVIQLSDVSSQWQHRAWASLWRYLPQNGNAESASVALQVEPWLCLQAWTSLAVACVDYERPRPSQRLKRCTEILLG